MVDFGFRISDFGFKRNELNRRQKQRLSTSGFGAKHQKQNTPTPQLKKSLQFFLEDILFEYAKCVCA
jgi:hypothetical protein